MSQIEITTLGKSCEFFNGKAHEKDIDENGKYIVVNSKFISSEGKSFKRTNEQMFPLYKGDIVMVMSDVPNGKALAKCFIIDKDDTYSLNQRICCIRSKEFDTKYLYYQLNRHEHFLAFNNGENQTNLRKDDILACPLIKPPMDEQVRMVKELDEAFIYLQKAIENVETNIENSNQLFSSDLNRLFSNPNWDHRKLEEVCKTGAGGTPLKTHKDYYEGGNIPWLLSGEVCQKEISTASTFITKKGLDNSSAKLFPVNTVLVAMYGATAGQVGILKLQACTNQAVCGILPNEKYLPEFIYYNFLFRKNELVAQATGNAQPNISQIKIKQTQIPYVDLNIQTEVVAKLNLLAEKSETLYGKYQEKLEKLNELRSGILKRAFENELMEAE
ncbi:MAG: restriction endonuclease subunit S [Bacteroidetes bacterium]|nr:restriction endonuclease subunit S [Bacteroidota bacterium]MCB9237364.1 restriction endonuclease subunit S [Flammeovirgaceae bacterium]